MGARKVVRRRGGGAAAGAGASPGAGTAGTSSSGADAVGGDAGADAREGGKVKLPVSELVAKAMQPDGRWNKENFKEFLDVVYWFKQIMAIVAAVICAVVPIPAPAAFAVYAGLTEGLAFLYCTKFANVDDEAYPPEVVFKEGLQSAIGVYGLVWITLYTALYHPGDLSML